MQLWRFNIVVFVLVTCACGKGEGDQNHHIPSLQIQCSSAEVSDCAQSGKQAYAGLIESLTLDCDQTLVGLNENQRKQLFAVTGASPAQRSGVYLTARITEWKNTTGGAQDVLNPGTYQVCAFIDSNSNGQLDANEPVGQGELKIGQSEYVLAGWNSAR